jgi:hypothetical protein
MAIEGVQIHQNRSNGTSTADINDGAYEGVEL